MKILWCGPFFSDKAIREKNAPNQAAAKWSRGLLRAIEGEECEIMVIDHCPEQMWPKGRVFWQDDDEKWFLDWYPCEKVSYCNAVGVKKVWLDVAYARRARKILREWHPDVVLCYNSLHSQNVIVMREARRAGVKAVPIILDGDDPRRDHWRKLLRDNRFADGVVFLSWWMYENYPVKSIPLLHMDGGAELPLLSRNMTQEIRNRKPPYILVHTGSLDYWRGLGFMQEVVRNCRRSDVRFVFCGKCDKTKMAAEFANDPRVDVRGFLSKDELDDVCREADVFLNVRTPGLGDNLVNYPSKIPNYLAWCKPVVTTWNDSFSPDYREILDVCDGTPEGFVQTLDKVLSRGADELELKSQQIREWFAVRKTWPCHALRLKNWLQGEVLR